MNKWCCMWIQYREIFQPEFWHIFNREVKLSASLKQKSTEIVLLSVGNMRRTKSLVNFLAVLISSIGCGLHNQEWKQLKTWLIFPNAFYISFHIHFTFFFFSWNRQWCFKCYSYFSFKNFQNFVCIWKK